MPRQLHLHVDAGEFVVELHALHDADRHALVLEDGLVRLDTGAAFKADCDHRAVRAGVAQDEPAAGDQGEEGHHPDERERTAGADDDGGGSFGRGPGGSAGASASHNRRESNVSVAKMVRTTVAANAAMPGSGSMLARWPNCTAPVRKATRNTSSIDQRPMNFTKA